jgi:hypothetical protein
LIYQTSFKETNVILFKTNYLLFIAMLLGLLACMYGGFIAITSSKTDNIKNALVLGILIELISIYGVLSNNTKPLWEDLISIVFILPATY